MGKRIAAIIVIYLFTAVAWVILGGTISSRTQSSGSGLRTKVAGNWGSEQTQTPPTASYTVRVTEMKEDEKGKARAVQYDREIPLPLLSSNINVDLNLEHRQKGLLWYATYKVKFAGTYTFQNDTAEERTVVFRLRFPTSQANYDDMAMTVDGQKFTIQNDSTSASIGAIVPAHKTVTLATGYRSQGLSTWTYSFSEGVAQVRDFTLSMNTDFKDIDFPENALSPSEKHETASGWNLVWKYSNMLTGYRISMVMPERLQPGPIAGEISFFAPIPLFFFFFLMFIITTLRRIELHPMNYLFLAAAFFAFHLLMAYTVDHIDIHVAFAIASTVSIFLVVTYLRLAVGMRFAAVEAGISQLVYLVLFSYAFFFKGFTGLAVTIGSIITLFVVMQMTGRIRWAERFDAAKQR